jgi:flagellar hook assembly protein FlgD
VEISIFNLQGQKVATLVRKHQTAGSHEIIWNGKDESGRRVASGVYLYRFKAGKFVQVKRMLMLR